MLLTRTRKPCQTNKTRRPDHVCGPQKAFTLAEVLITLAIIGVVAALTIPTVVRNYQDKVLKTQLKKAYSTITRAYQSATLLDNGGIALCYQSADRVKISDNYDCDVLFSNLTKRLGVAKYCPNNALAKGCLSKYTKFSACYDYSKDVLETSSSVYILNDGMLLTRRNHYNTPGFVLDINGLKGPNKAGIDYFVVKFEKQENENILLKETISCGVIETGGRILSDALKWANQ